MRLQEKRGQRTAAVDLVQDLFRRKLDAAGKAVPFSVFKAYMLQAGPNGTGWA